MQELITNLSHDFRTPLSIINTSAHLLQFLVEPEKRRERAEQITAVTTRLNGILEDILYMSRLELLEDGTLERIDLNALLAGCMETLQAALGYRSPLAFETGYLSRRSLLFTLTKVGQDQDQIAIV